MNNISNIKLADMVDVIVDCMFNRAEPASWQEMTIKDIQQLGVDPVIILKEAAVRFALQTKMNNTNN